MGINNLLKEKNNSRVVLILLSFLWFMPGKAQDIHFSQFYHSPMNINPALTGVFKEDIRFMGNYRSQWQSVPVPFLTFSAAADMKFFHRKFSNGFFGAGVILNHDRAGDAEMRFTQITFSGSYTHQLNENNLLTLGFQFGTGQRRYSTEKLSFGNQFNGDEYVSSLPSREEFRNTQVFYADFSTGLNWHLQQEDQRYWLDLGAGIFHLARPNVSFEDQMSSPLKRRFSLYGMGGFQLNDKWDLLLNALGQFQGKSKEMIVGTAARYRINQARGKELAIQLGTSYRFIGANDALIPTFEVHYNAWVAAVSYDINLSDFRQATERKGGPEVAVIYTITKVKPLKEHRVCPIF